MKTARKKWVAIRSICAAFRRGYCWHTMDPYTGHYPTKKAALDGAKSFWGVLEKTRLNIERRAHKRKAGD